MQTKIVFNLFLSALCLLNNLSGMQVIKLATTTSVDDSGLFSKVIPIIEKKFALRLQILAVGSGQALRIASDGNCELAIAHSPLQEIELLARRPDIQRIPLMFNYFLLVGPKDDPAGLKNLSIEKALQKISAQNIRFVSRGDYSGTYEKELELWKKIKIKPIFKNYFVSGSGMQITLRIADQKKAYTLVDSASFYFLEKVLPQLTIICDSPKEDLKNNYSLLVVHQKDRKKEKLLKMIVSFFQCVEFKRILTEHKVNGQQLFFTEEQKN